MTTISKETLAEAVRAAEQATGAGEWMGKGAPGGTRTLLGAALLATVEALTAAERERDELRERVAELEAAPGGVAVAGLLSLLARAAESLDELADLSAEDENGIRDPESRALASQLRDAAKHLAAPTPEQRAAAEVLALGQRYQPDSETSAADYLDHVETLASEGLPLDTPWEEVRTDRDRCKWAAAMALCGIVACDAKPGGGT